MKHSLSSEKQILDILKKQDFSKMRAAPLKAIHKAIPSARYHELHILPIAPC